ncbi:hypothetical protein K4L44_02645 [Halosquirtibacter laminarini]|uniref:Uncharacterized protein n=1 Tax=Halosquirtibacter laminarini TaxID=3374600 RepID=A0AC61NNH6_9BACT|nr:hypothetical protein K4L44_02645 [Prolixibacteraceae bacterium]
MRKICVLLFLMLGWFVQLGYGQNKYTLDVGAYLSTNYLLGEVFSNSIVASQRPKFGAAVRYNMRDRYCFQSHFGFGFLYDEGVVDQNIANLGLDDNITNQYNYDRLYFELGGSWDFNWKPFAVENRFMNFTFFSGIGLNLLYFPDNGHGVQNSGYIFSPSVDGERSFITLGVPLQFGGKWNLSGYRSLSVAFIAQKLFSDAADNLDDPYSVLAETNKTSFHANDLMHNNDWIFELKVSLYFQVYHGCRACPDFN